MNNDLAQESPSEPAAQSRNPVPDAMPDQRDDSLGQKREDNR